jgi:hypothetical protein
MSSAGILLGLREYILLSLKELPLIASAGPLFVGLVQGNVNLILFALGTAIIAPSAAGLSGWLLKYPLEWLKVPPNWWKVASSDVSPLLPEAPSIGIGLRNAINVVPTYWFTMSVFFFAYLALNAAALYNEPSRSGADKDKVDNRKNQAIMSLILISTLGLAILAAKVWLSGGETALGAIVGLLVGVGTASAWFKFLRQCGMGRLEDVFGIQARILPEAAVGEAPVVCV